MVRNPSKRSEEKPEIPQMPQAKGDQQDPQNVQVIEREVNLALINDKLNYVTGLLHKIAEACEVDLNSN